MSRSPHLDPRAPLVIDTRELGRQAGALMTLQRTVAAPAGMSLGLVGVAAGSPLGLDLRLAAVVEGVLVTGSVTAELTGECGRCLGPLTEPLVTGVQELYGHRPDPADEERPCLDGDLIDLEPAVRDAVVLAMPVQPRCRVDCPGLCPRCGVPLAEQPDHDHPAADPRWSVLAGVFDDNRSEQES